MVPQPRFRPARARPRHLAHPVPTVDLSTRSYAAAAINERFTEPGITLPSVAPPAGNYVGFVIVDRTAHVGGRGDAGRRTRTAVRIADLPFAIAVEIEMTFHVRD